MNTLNQLNVFRALVHTIFGACAHVEWTLQGMGLLRCHMPGNLRLHVWDSRFRYPGVSMIHDHMQWDLESFVVCGHVRNQRYRPYLNPPPNSKPYHYGVFRTGKGTEMVADPKIMHLLPAPEERYSAGASYFQRSYEIHETDAKDGTVTIMQKAPKDTANARIFWPEGTEWGNAEARTPTAAEVDAIITNALDVMHREMDLAK